MENNSLLVKDAEFSYGGVYKILAENGVGVAEYSFALIIGNFEIMPFQLHYASGKNDWPL